MLGFVNRLRKRGGKRHDQTTNRPSDQGDRDGLAEQHRRLGVAQWRDRVCADGGGGSLAELAGGGGVINEEQEMKTIEERKVIYEALADGKQIECFSISGEWKPTTGAVIDWGKYDYRVKPEPTKQSVAYAFIHKLDGYVFWTVSPERHIDRMFYQRCPEFDIIASNKGQE